MDHMQRLILASAFRGEGVTMTMLWLLSEEEQRDVRDGRCVYREYQGTPILDYQEMPSPTPALADGFLPEGFIPGGVTWIKGMR